MCVWRYALLVVGARKEEEEGVGFAGTVALLLWCLLLVSREAGQQHAAAGVSADAAGVEVSENRGGQRRCGAEQD